MQFTLTAQEAEKAASQKVYMLKAAELEAVRSAYKGGLMWWEAVEQVLPQFVGTDWVYDSSLDAVVRF